MDDALKIHAERAAAANEALIAAFAAARDEADARMRERIAGFGEKLLGLAREADAARDALVEELTALSAVVRQGCREALDAHLAEVALSAGAMQAELADRMAFVTTGKLPDHSPRLPPVTPLTYSDDEPSGELVILRRGEGDGNGPNENQASEGTAP